MSALSWIRSWFPYARFEIADRALWRRLVAQNRDDYGVATNRFAAEWAHDVEMATKGGIIPFTWAVPVCRDCLVAKHAGMSHGQLAAATQTLIRVWAHGEELREWKEGA